MLREVWPLALFVVAIAAYPNVAPNAPTPSGLLSLHQQSNTTDETEKATTDFRTCIKDLVDLDQLKNEIQGAESDSSALNTLAKKYCDKTTQLKTCIHAYVDKVGPGRKLHKIFLTNPLIDQDIDYLCQNDGEKITTFVGEQGLECLEEKGTALEQCGDKALNSLAIEDRASFDDDTISTAKLCAFTDHWFSCLVTEYKTCTSTKPATILEALFSFLRKNSACNEALPKN